MRTMLLSFKADVNEKILSEEKIYEHRKNFPDEPIKAYLHVNTPTCAITGILLLGKQHKLVEWREQYSFDHYAVERINEYLLHNRYTMEILEFQETNAIALSTLRKELDKFVVPQMYYYLDGISLLNYLEQKIKPTGLIIQHQFDGVSSNDICIN